ncbi:hypothetical protein U14_03425 [Candidatus Moduliflexus flocculans]|uniref:Uncharacterized protein n=1 Tax=Candidatus Moduliflexus flocculans TaxID=1499966 RepID=A0A081BP58_9BACT|nr:hypothetical protein U14_03425 [Candidatus Moduliflexus flocculans]
MLARQSRRTRRLTKDLPMRDWQQNSYEMNEFGDDEPAERIIEFYKHHDDPVMELIDHDIFSDVDFDFEERGYFLALA